MSNIFEDVISGDITDELFTEAVYPDNIPYLKSLRKQVLLPQGNPIGKGCICFLYSNSFEDSLKLMNNPKNFLPKNKYHYYYYNRDYIGKLLGRRYRFRDNDIRKKYYHEIKSSTKLIPILNTLSLQNNKNMFYDLHRYINIFQYICYNHQQVRYLNEYWNYMRNLYEIDIIGDEEEDPNDSPIDEIIDTVTDYVSKPKNKHLYTTKFVLVDVSKFNCGKNWKDNIHNPLYLLYYGMYRKTPSLVGTKDKKIKPLNIDFYFFNDKKILKINPAKMDVLNDPKVLVHYKAEMMRLLQGVSKKEDVEKATDAKELDRSDVEDKVIAKTTNLLQPNPDVETPDTDKVITINTNMQKLNKVSAVQKMVEVKAKEDLKKSEPVLDTSPENANAAADKVASDAKKELEADREAIEKIYNQMKKELPKKSDASTARDKMLREEQKNLNVGGMTIKDLEKIKTSNVPVPVRDVTKAVTTTNENMKELRFVNFDKTYNEQVMKKDIVNTFLALNDKSIPIFIRDIKVEDTSNELNYKDTYTVYLEDGNRKRHTIKVDIPKFVDDKFLYLGGNKKILKHQNFYYPVVKISPNMVQLVSNYSKMTIERVENKSVSSIERLKKIINKNDDFKKYFVSGSQFSANKDYVTSIEYDDLSKIFSSFKCDKTYFLFGQKDAIEYMKKKNYPEKKNKIFIGEYKNNPCYIDYNTQESEDGYSITEMISESLPEDLREEYTKTKAPKRLMFAKVRLMAQFINVGMLLGMWEGLSTVLKKLKVEYRLEDKVNSMYKANEDYIKFKDCVLVYKQTIPNAMILNGIKAFNTENYNIVDFDESQPYLDYTRKVYGRSIIENAIMNFYEFFIDSITLEILRDQNLPTDVVGLMIYAINLLADSQYIPNINQNLSRVRQGEIIPAILYEKIAKNYVDYRNSNGRKKYSVPQDCVIKEILGLKTVEDYSTLNPTLELQQTHAISSKGFNGVNLDEAYTVPRRAYDPSMTGVIAPGTSPDGTVGISKFLSMEPKITNLRGYTEDYHDDLNKLKDVNLHSPAELSLPGATTVDEPNRLG